VTTPTTDRVRRPDHRAAYARMTPGVARVAATVAAIEPLLTNPEFPTGYAATLAQALVVVRDVHARECDQPGCRTCRAIRVGIATITAHQLAIGGQTP
jgi:hypothetical protein